MIDADVADSLLPPGTVVLTAMLGHANEIQLAHPLVAAAAELASLYAESGDDTAHARIVVMRRIDAYTARVLPTPTESAVLHTETVSMVLARMAGYTADLGNPFDRNRLKAVWGPLDELIRGIDALFIDLLAGRRVVPVSIWWPTDSHPDSSQEGI